MTIAVIGHVCRPRFPVLRSRAALADRELLLCRPFRGEALPDPDGLDGVVVLGGPQSAYDDEAYLRTEIDYLTRLLDHEVPILAICLGSQLLAVAGGGRAIPGTQGLELGVVDVLPTDDTGQPPAGRYYSFHSDTVELPTDAEVLATTDRYLQAWRLGSALAVQFHPELDRDGYQSILDAEEDKLTRFGVDVDAARAQVAVPLPVPSPSEQLIDNWLASVAPTSRTSRTAPPTSRSSS